MTIGAGPDETVSKRCRGICTIGNQLAKYEHPQLKIERRVLITTVLRHFVTLTFEEFVLRAKPIDRRMDGQTDRRDRSQYVDM